MLYFETGLEGSAAVYFTRYLEATSEGHPLGFYEIKPHALAINVGVKTAIKAKQFFTVPGKVNAESIVCHAQTDLILCAQGADVNNRIASRMPIFDGIADEVVKNAVEVRFYSRQFIGLPEVCCDLCATSCRAFSMVIPRKVPIHKFSFLSSNSAVASP